MLGIAERLDLGGAAGGVGPHDRLQPCWRMKLRHCASACTWLRTTRTSSSVAPGSASRWWCTGSKCSPMMYEARIRHQVVDVGDPAGDRILDRDHAERRPALAHRREGVLEAGAGQRRHLGKDAPAGEIGIGARLALEGDRLFRIVGGSIGLLVRRLCAVRRAQAPSITACHPAISARARSRSAGVSTWTPSQAGSIRLTEMRMPASSARNCSSRSRCSSTPRGSVTKRSSAARR